MDLVDRDQRITELERDLAESNAILEAIGEAMVGGPVSDFMGSYPLVRSAIDLRLRLANQEHVRELETKVVQLTREVFRLSKLVELGQEMRRALALAYVGLRGRADLPAVLEEWDRYRSRP